MKIFQLFANFYNGGENMNKSIKKAFIWIVVLILAILVDFLVEIYYYKYVDPNFDSYKNIWIIHSITIISLILKYLAGLLAFIYTSIGLYQVIKNPDAYAKKQKILAFLPALLILIFIVIFIFWAVAWSGYTN